jgi:phage shock protein E
MNFSWRTVLSLGVVSIFLAACQPPAATGAIASTELSERINSNSAPMILDVRTVNEYSEAHLPGAVLIPHDEVAARIAELPADKSTEIVVHCHSGRRAGIAEAELKNAGYSNVRHLEGDYAAWADAGLQLERD